MYKLEEGISPTTSTSKVNDDGHASDTSYPDPIVGPHSHPGDSFDLTLKQQRKSTSSTLSDRQRQKLAKTTTCMEFIKSKLFISIIIVLCLIITLICIGFVITFEEDNDVQHNIDAWKDKLSIEQMNWYNSGLDELKIALKTRINTRKAKNVILFVGDGMGPTTVTAARINKYGEGGEMSWEKFPHMGLLKTYCTDRQVPDSMSTATALFGGVKGNYQTGGVDEAVTLGDCRGTLNGKNQVLSIIELAQEAGMSTGFVTTTRVMHATPSALYAHVPDRRWECEANMNEEDKKMGCKDIARQLIEDAPGRNINVSVLLGHGK